MVDSSDKHSLAYLQSIHTEQCDGNDQRRTWTHSLKHLLVCFPQPAESFAGITAVIDMRCKDPKPAVFTVVTPAVLPVYLLT